jgi:hypothetical protein
VHGITAAGRYNIIKRIFVNLKNKKGDDLLATLTLEKKIGQLTQLNLGGLELEDASSVAEVLDPLLIGNSVGVI